MTARIAIAIVCTDKGQHPETALGDLSIYDGSVYANEVVVHREIADRQKSECVWIDLTDAAPFRVNMRCPRCRRHLEWSYPESVGHITRLHEHGVNQLDMSYWKSDWK